MEGMDSRIDSRVVGTVAVPLALWETDDLHLFDIDYTGCAPEYIQR